MAWGARNLVSTLGPAVAVQVLLALRGARKRAPRGEEAAVVAGADDDVLDHDVGGFVRRVVGAQ